MADRSGEPRYVIKWDAPTIENFGQRSIQVVPPRSPSAYARYDRLIRQPPFAPLESEPERTPLTFVDAAVWYTTQRTALCACRITEDDVGVALRFWTASVARKLRPFTLQGDWRADELGRLDLVPVCAFPPDHPGRIARDW